jgi:hypothetical protein
MQAKEEIFITDWWLSPDLLLKRGKDQERYKYQQVATKWHQAFLFLSSEY